jgi:hypothetical protein
VLSLSPVASYRSLALVEMTTFLVRNSQDLAQAGRTAHAAVDHCPSSVNAVLTWLVLSYLTGDLSRSGLERSLRTSLRRLRKAYDAAYWERLLTLWRRLVLWLDDLHLVEDKIALAKVLSRVLS